MTKITVGVTVITVVAVLGGCTGFGKVVLSKPSANDSLDHSYLFGPNYRVPHIQLTLPEVVFWD